MNMVVINGMSSALTDYLIITTVGTALLLIHIAWRLIRPFKCDCKFQTVFARRMLKHLATKHGYKP